MTNRIAILFLLLLPLSVAADFSNSQLTPHPRYPGVGPFILDVTGTWPTDCHPGEQKPVIESYDGESVEIVFETIVEHITCNDEDTRYRVLIDMSDAISAGEPLGTTLKLKISFDEETLEQVLQLVCPEDKDCSNNLSNQQLAEPGLYFSQGLAKQGLLLARQNEAMAIYPLVYDSNGRNQWLFTGATMTEDTFFTELLRFRGGDCFGCESTGTAPKMSVAGRLSVLVDRPGLLQVKFNDGMFTAYDSLTYGYKTVEVGKPDRKTLIDLEGRWAISENLGSDTPLGDLTRFIPAAFDLVRDTKSPNGGSTPTSGRAYYTITTLSGQFIGQLLCKGETGDDGSNMCEFIDATDQEQPLFRIYQQGPTRLAIEYGRELESEGVPPSGSAVRLD